MRSRPLASHLDDDRTLSAITEKARRLAALQRVLAREAPVGMARMCAVANLRDGVVVIHAANNATAAKMRLILPRLLASFQANRADVNGVRIELQTPRTPTNGAGRRPTRVISASAGAQLDACAAGLPDSPLRQALHNLAQRATKTA